MTSVDASVDASVDVVDDGAAWVTVHGGQRWKFTAPVLHGSNSGRPWSLSVSLKAARKNVRTLEVPGRGNLIGVVLSGYITSVAAARAECPAFGWELTIVPHAPGVLMRLRIQPADAGAHPETTLEHITLVTTEIGQASNDGREIPFSAPPSRGTVAGRALVAALTTSGGAVAAGATGGLTVAAGLTAAASCGLLWGYLPRRSPHRTSVLVNGWQSFSFSGALGGGESQPRTPLPYFSAAFHLGLSAPPAVSEAAGDDAVLTSDLFAVVATRCRRATGPGHQGDEAGPEGAVGGGMVLGFLTARKGIGGVCAVHSAVPRAHLVSEQRATLAAGGVAIETDWALALPFDTNGSSDVAGTTAGASALRATAQYVEMVASLSNVPPARVGLVASRETSASGETGGRQRTTPPVGWCSWYCHGPDVCEELMMGTVRMLRDARGAGRLPIDLVQLDDGWQSNWGDWMDPHPTRFPNGLKPLTRAIREAGMLPGLWMAPAALTARSRLIVEHPEWILRDSSGTPLRCGYTAPGIWLHALDVTHPEALAYVRRAVGLAVHEWGFGYLKLDFLHTAAMPGGQRHDPNVTRAEVLWRLMAAVRDEVGEEVFILGCGAPLGPCIAHVDGMRVSADAAPHWLPRVADLPLVRSLFTHDRTNMPAARNMVRNVAVRMPLSGRLWRNDPDCLILRDHGAEFSLGQVWRTSTWTRAHACVCKCLHRQVHIHPYAHMCFH